MRYHNNASVYEVQLDCEDLVYFELIFLSCLLELLFITLQWMNSDLQHRYLSHIDV
jgi:hypothetical protein